MKYINCKSRYLLSLIDMEIAHENVLNGAEECVFITEHEGVYSAGKSSENSDFLLKPNFPIYHPKRGGRVTVHSPGQIVIYPIINLKKRGITVSEYILLLENWMIEVLAKFCIKGHLSDQGIGVWAQGAKIGFVGIRIEKGVSSHGICLNVSNDLDCFDTIIPCGINNIKITSIEKIISKKIEVSEVAKEFILTSKLV